MKFSTSSKKFENPEPGTYAAVCTRIVDLGTQRSNWQGEEKFAHKVQLFWEINENMTDGRPFMVSRQFTVSLHEKAGLRQFLAGWRGRDFTPEELGGFHAKKLLGAGCMLSLVQKGDYVNVDSASKLPKGMTAPAPVGELIYISLDNEFDPAQLAKLSNNMQEKIKASPEYVAMNKNTMEDLESDQPWEDEDVF